MIHEDPRAYLLGMEGAALLRAFTGHHDREFVRARLAEVRCILDTPMDPVDVERAGAVEGYGLWAASYDGEDNGAFPLDTPVLTEVLDGIAPGPALDAAAGTGRLTRLLLDRGHRVTAVDSSPDMLGHNPADDTRVGDLRALPVGDAEVDVVVCGLALTHVPDLGPVFAEFARVLRPGGHLVLSEVHPEAVARGSVPTVRGRGNRPMRLVTHEHLLGDYLRAALAAGLELRRFTEPVPPPAPPREASTDPGPWDVWPWSLAAMVPEATRAATGGRPAMLVAHWRRG
ncbi:Methyltransferase type 11 [Actinokineospora spheciospongiae]|uniref:Methyltransferase type 11 n=1 Tax=Actinokineospora spheciospongiae TaxID=909613 RepID=W7IRC9_9PSEU|nr:class I SAM-dependent methyltransferase [Actinokineospora spheciospongiae]EWC59202.1 Methyltransferase type 11 [Actinokineospora spheciospongiae]